MAQLQYPTIDLIQDYIHSIYSSSSRIQIDITVLGDAVGKNTDNGKYVVISLPDQEPLIGIDIPVLVKKSRFDRPVIAIVAQDPLRSKTDKMLPVTPPGNAIIGTPFALHYNEEKYLQTAVYRRIIEMLLEEGYDVYITDACKIYPRKKGLKKNDEIDLLKREIIDRIKPCLAITLGSDAKKYFNKIKKLYEERGGKVINLLHPSQQNWDHWKQWIFEQAFYEKDRGETGPYAGIADSFSRRSTMFDDQKFRDPKKTMPDLIVELVRIMIENKLKEILAAGHKAVVNNN